MGVVVWIAYLSSVRVTAYSYAPTNLQPHTPSKALILYTHRGHSLNTNTSFSFGFRHLHYSWMGNCKPWELIGSSLWSLWRFYLILRKWESANPFDVVPNHKKSARPICSDHNCYLVSRWQHIAFRWTPLFIRKIFNKKIMFIEAGEENGRQ